MNVRGSRWHDEDEFRQMVIRRAQLLGFECIEQPATPGNMPSYYFFFENQRRYQYASLYSAAYDYLRLMKVPHEVIGAYNP